MNYTETFDSIQDEHGGVGSCKKLGGFKTGVGAGLTELSARKLKATEQRGQMDTARVQIPASCILDIY